MAADAQQALTIDVVGSSTFGIRKKISPSKTYNMYISDDWLTGYLGYKKVIDLLTDRGTVGEGRALFRSIRGNMAIAVIDATVWRLDAQTGATFVGNINTSTGPVFMDENLSAQICIVDGLNAYIYNRDNFTLTIQNLAADVVPNYVRYHNTYFLIGNNDRTGNGAKWFAYSRASDDIISVSYELALETKPDYAIAVERLPGKGNNVVVFGTSVAEVHTNVGGLLGYQRVSTLNIDYGCLSVATIASSDTFICWLAVNQANAPCIMVFDGGQAVQISTDGIDYVLAGLKFPQKSCAFFYKSASHLFYQITFYSEEDNLTLFYDFKTKKFFHASDASLNFHPARQVIYLNEKNYFVSLNNGSVYEISQDLTTYDENIGDKDSANYEEWKNYVIPRQRICSTQRLPGAKKFRSRHFSFPMEQGNDDDYSELAYLYAGQQAILTEEGEDMLAEDGQLLILEDTLGDLEYQPAVDLSFSTDGGYTFTTEVRRVCNFMAKRRNMIFWNRLGSGNEMTIKLKFWGKYQFSAGNGELLISP